MAVAVKTSQGARPSSLLANPAILSLIGVVYLISCLGIVFKLLPFVWWQVLDALGLDRFVFVGGSALVLVALVVGLGLILLGARLLGPQPPVGVRAGVFVAFAGLLLVLVLARWASLWLEFWAFMGAIHESTGWITTTVVAIALLLLWIRLFTRPWMQNYVVRLEEAGWFHAISYKHNQGQKVRRATIFGILLLVGAGIWTLLSQGSLRKGPPDWVINIPFTGKVAVESYGDAEKFLVPLADSAKDPLEVRSPGDSNLRVRDRISLARYAEVVQTILAATKRHLEEEQKDLERQKGAEKDPDDVKTLERRIQQVRGQLANTEATEEALHKAREEGPVVFLKTVSERTYAAMQQLLDAKAFKPDVVRRLREIDNRSNMADLTELVAAFRREAEAAKKSDELGGVFRLPTAVLLVDRFAMRKVDEEASTHVRIVLKGDSKFPEGDIVSRTEFDEEVARLEAERKKGRDRELPKEAALTPPGGPTRYAGITMLPSVQFTVPLLLIAVSLWLAWRIVNMPTFADFLIATEAELNKVSWTTQKRLVQDTVVVLITTLLLAVFLFGMDWTWKVVLSWKPIGVLHIPTEQADETKGVEQKRW